MFDKSITTRSFNSFLLFSSAVFHMCSYAESCNQSYHYRRLSNTCWRWRRMIGRRNGNTSTNLWNTGYPSLAMTQCAGPRNKKNSESRRGKAKAQYPSLTSEACQRSFVGSSSGIGAWHYFKTCNTLRQLLCVLKDLAKKEEVSGIVYQINCEEKRMEKYVTVSTQGNGENPQDQDGRAAEAQYINIWGVSTSVPPW